ncbi:MAG: metal-sensitive transcriptional regulator [Firmicutes bacterium]|nr:metal-sensitive transcriptional regulator [Bacillota bacterium]
MDDLNETAVKELIDRLHTIKGHLNGIEKMITEGRKCDDILLQLVAIRAALDKLSAKLAEHYVIQCYEAAVNEGIDPKEMLARALQVVIKFTPS